MKQSTLGLFLDDESLPISRTLFMINWGFSTTEIQNPILWSNTAPRPVIYFRNKSSRTAESLPSTSPFANNHNHYFLSSLPAVSEEASTLPASCHSVLFPTRGAPNGSLKFSPFLFLASDFGIQSQTSPFNKYMDKESKYISTFSCLSFLLVR